ncbi:hypothetical protein DSM3645_03578 [Blastopirellula marina DSM 3645]|uniref:Uncharacterized protein n=1 Tax=Blastopirellula marina DSM 3645 TaxID=314230 RepID=A3ZW29_9BACT|nr:hypothetical protein DSM3645_03578 [Blastopirellula marina DSM 3645]
MSTRNLGIMHLDRIGPVTTESDDRVVQLETSSLIVALNDEKGRHV